jgi:hypothetical protein
MSIFAPSGQRGAEVLHRAVDLDRERGAREALADRACGVEAGRAGFELELLSVG